MGDIFGDTIPFNMLWPPEPRYLNVTLPDEVGQAYSEAVLAEKSELWMSASVMAGRALEAICRIYAPRAKTISSALSEMKESGVLSEEMYRWSTEIRLVRNHGAHLKNSSPSSTEVKYAIDFLCSLAEILFEIRPKFERFLSSRGKVS